MKVAIVHDWLGSTRGGAEETLLRLAKLYPKADIMCLTYDAKRYPELGSRRVITSRLQHLPRFIRKRRNLLLAFAPRSIEKLGTAGYDLVISSSNSFAKGVRTGDSTLHICYCYSPMRFVWDYWPQVVQERGRNPLTRLYLYWLTHRLRLWDFTSSRGVDAWVAISKTVATRIKKYYRQPSSVIYPSIIDELLYEQSELPKGDYYVTLSTLAAYKRVDVAVAACLASRRQLVVIGDGPMRASLAKQIGGNWQVRLAGRVSDAHKKALLQNARGLIFPSEEDFGIAPIEAMAAGTPVIAYGKGGLTETVTDGETGMFFNEPTPDSLQKALDQFESRKWDADACRTQAHKFSLQHFDAEFSDFVIKTYDSWKAQQ